VPFLRLRFELARVSTYAGSVGRPGWLLPHAELAKSGQPFEEAGARPHPPPAISLGTEPSSGVSRPLPAVRGL
jgi:hypothetical protein